MTRFCRKLQMLAPAWFVMIAYTVAADTALFEPHSPIVDHSLPRGQVGSQVMAARRDDTFWNTGDEALARAALAPNLFESTLAIGRPQRLAGPLGASKLVRAAIPDLGCDTEQMIVADDRVVASLRFHGRFTGHLGRSKATARRSISSPSIFTGSPTDASLRIAHRGQSNFAATRIDRRT